MKLGVLACVLGDRSLADALKYLDSLGVQAVEIGAGGVTGNAHCNTAELLADSAKLAKFKETFKPYDMEISALDCHENMVHPDKDLQQKLYTDLKNTILFGEKIGCDRVVTFSGCPGEPGGKYPNWITQPWPDDFEKLWKWQWEEVLFPFWTEAAAFAKNHGVKLCIEMHPGFNVYNPETLLKLRGAVDDTIGCTFDPSNIVWQNIDVPTAVRELGPAIYNFHAKDSIEAWHVIRKNGRLDAKNYADRTNRAWSFRTVGYGHDEFYWKQIMSELVDVGYDRAINIEHEDTYMTQQEGLEKAVAFLKNVMIMEKAGEMWWANVDLREGE